VSCSGVAPELHYLTKSSVEPEPSAALSEAPDLPIEATGKALLLDFQVVVGLEVDPEGLRHAEELREPEGGVGGNRPLAKDDLIDASRVDVNVLFLPAQSPNNLNSILGNIRVSADQKRFFHDGLCSQQAVKWVFVMCRQVLQGQHMLQRSGKYLYVVGVLLAFDNFPQWQSQPELSQLKFNLHFPDADNAQHQDILAILAKRQSLRRKLGRFTIPPDKRMRVQ